MEKQRQDLKAGGGWDEDRLKNASESPAGGHTMVVKMTHYFPRNTKQTV